MEFKLLNSLRQKISSIPGVKGLSYITVGNGINYLLGALFWLGLARIVEPELYGKINTFFGMTTLFGFLSLFGINIYILVYYPETKNDKIIEEGFFFALLFGSMAAIFTILPFSSQITLTEGVILWLVVISNMIATLLMARWIAKNQYQTFTLHIILLRISRIVFGLSFYLATKSGIMILFGFIIGTIPYYIIFIRKIKVFKISISWLVAYFNRVKHNFIYSAFTSSFLYADKIILWLLFDQTFLGIYQFSFQFYLILTILPQSLLNILLTDRKASNHNSIFRLSFIISLLVSLIIYPVVSFIFPYIYPNYVDSAIYIWILSLQILPLLFVLKVSASYMKEDKYSTIHLSYLIALILYLAFLFFIDYFALMTILVPVSLTVVTILQAFFLYVKRWYA